MLAGVLNGLGAVLIAVGGADVVVVRFRGVQIVVVGVCSRGGQPFWLPLPELSEAGADFHVRVLGLDLPDDLGHLVDVAVGWPAAARHQTHPLRAARDSGLRGSHGVLVPQPPVFQDVGLGTETLGAVETVLRAQTRFEVDQGCIPPILRPLPGLGTI